ncbi:MAG: 8-oxo-dGTP diphosphatase [Myxococcota bacterium]|nr:8-oxo-dGTP diphosphatase [Myxococcota bacterium]
MVEENNAERSVRTATPIRVATLDWSNWSPTHHATLTFIQAGSRVLLIRKKRGLGAGLINGPGGKLERNESAAECAVREVEEEVGLTPLELEERGELRFQFVDGYAIHVHVFVAHGHRGQLCETEEAKPIWFDISDIPYEEMWADDRLWLPHVLSGGSVRGDFIFDDQEMVDHRLICS